LPVRRLSSRRQRLHEPFADLLKGAASYDRIAGYFRSSVFEIAGEAFERVEGPVRIVCNSSLDIADIATARTAAKAMRTDWCDGRPERMTEAQRPRYERLHGLLTSGKVEIRVLPDASFGLVHGKAGVVRYADGGAVSFLGSINETADAWTRHYELLWTDDDPAAVSWVAEEFEALWTHRDARCLSEAVVADVEHILRRELVGLPAWRPRDEPQAPFVEAPVSRSGDGLAPHQRAFVATVVKEIETYGEARFINADDVGLGKTVQLGMAAEFIALTTDMPVLVLAPKNLLSQWQGELMSLLGCPSARWEQPGRWITEDGAVWPSTPETCPRRIGLFPTSLVTARSPVADRLLGLRYGCIVLDEAHRARQSGGIGQDREPNNLLHFMLQIARRTKSLLMGTATPIQMDRRELFDLMKILHAGCERILGGIGSRWENPDLALDMVAGKAPMPDTPATAWQWLREPLIPPGEHPTATRIRDELEVPESEWRASPDAVNRFSPALHDNMVSDADRLLRQHNPFVRHVIKRRRRELRAADGSPYFKEIGIRLHGESESDALEMPPSMQAAYDDARRFCELVGKRQRGAGILKTLLLRRIGSSLNAGLSTARKLLEKERGPELVGEEDEDLDATAQAFQPDTEEYRLLRSAIERMEDAGNGDPKLGVILRYLRAGWLERGCLLFSQYYDTVAWIAEQLAASFTGTTVGVYAGLGNTYLIERGLRHSVTRPEIQELVRRRELKLLVATDAASEGLNLQRLQTLIHVDLPWNPARLEQRKGRIERIGQEADVIDILNLRYRGSVEDDVYRALSARLEEIRDVFGTIPDTLEDVWVQAAIGEMDQAMRVIDAVPKQHPFAVRYTDSLPEAEWDRCNQVLNQIDLAETLKAGW
jgi:superfamily II DNA or RNA helicase